MRVRFHFTYLFVILILLFELVTLPVSAVPMPASEQGFIGEEKVVRVFYPLQKGLTERDENGIYSGYSYEYLMDIAQLTGWKYEYVVSGQTNEDLQDGLDAVKNGDIDLACSMAYFPVLESDYLYSAMPYGATNYTLITPENNQKLNNRTISGYQDLKVALVESAKAQNQLFDDYCAKQGLSYQPVFADDNAACRELVESGQADAMISKDAVFLDGYKTIFKFASQPFYFAAGKGNEELMSQLNWALYAINSADPDLQNRLYRKYFTKTSDYALNLTSDELEYLEHATAVRVAVYTDRAPIQDYDPKTGQFSGIMTDVLELISQRSGLSFELIAADNREQARKLIEAGDVDLVGGIPHSYDDPKKLYLSNVLLTSPILSLPIIRVNHLAAESKSDELLAYSDTKLFQGQDNVRYEDDIKEILRLVNQGEYSEAYVDGYIAQHYMENGNFRNVILTLTPYGNYPLCLGVVRGEDIRLISILNQAIASLSQADMESIIYKNTSHSRQTSIIDLVKRNPAPFAFGSITVLIAVSVLLFLLFLKTNRLNRLISAEKSRYKEISQLDSLTGVFNNATFRFLSERYLSSAFPPPKGVLLILDIDHFKMINDNFGHLAGDEALCDLSNLLRTVFRGDDIIGRLGGDEFAVLIKDMSDQESIAKRCESLIRECRNVSSVFNVTISIGGVFFSRGTDFEELFKQADATLYEVKQQGRNGCRLSVYKTP